METRNKSVQLILSLTAAIKSQYYLNSTSLINLQSLILFTVSFAIFVASYWRKFCFLSLLSVLRFFCRQLTLRTTFVLDTKDSEKCLRDFSKVANFVLGNNPGLGNGTIEYIALNATPLRAKVQVEVQER